MIVEYEKRGRTAVITLNRPEARNAVSGELARALEEAIDKLEADDDVWVGILSRQRPRLLRRRRPQSCRIRKANLGTSRGGFGGFVTLERTKPVIAAVEGPAVAGGCELVLACDLVVASPNASFGLPEVKRSLVAMAGGTTRLPKRVPQNIAMEMALTGDTITAERAHQHGLVNILCEPGEAINEAISLAERINSNAPLAVRATRKAVLEERW